MRSSHFLERIANSPPVLTLTTIAALFAFDRPLSGDQLSFVSVILQEPASIVMDFGGLHWKYSHFLWSDRWQVYLHTS